MQDPDNFEVGYNCTSNALANKALVISSDQITPKVLGEEGYMPVVNEQVLEGDIGIYQPKGGDEITHFEPFITSDKVSSKGGIAKDPGPQDPGQNPSFKQGANYSVIRKTTENATTESVPASSGTNGVHKVDSKTFEKIKEEVKH